MTTNFKPQAILTQSKSSKYGIIVDYNNNIVTVSRFQNKRWDKPNIRKLQFNTTGDAYFTYRGMNLYIFQFEDVD